ncbi:MAG: hypothetical protein ACKO38_20305 [Planctomycetota bacterium]
MAVASRTEGPPNEGKSDSHSGKQGTKRWDNLPEWQRLALQGAVMVVTATLVVAVSAWWSGGKRNADSVENPSTSGSPAPLLATNASGRDADADSSSPVSGNGVDNDVRGNRETDKLGTAALNTTTPSTTTPDTTTPNTTTPNTMAANAMSGPQLSGPLGNSSPPATVAGTPTMNSMDEDAPYTMARPQPTTYPSTSPQSYQYPTTGSAFGPGIDASGDSYPRVGDNLPSRPGAPR